MEKKSDSLRDVACKNYLLSCSTITYWAKIKEMTEHELKPHSAWLNQKCPLTQTKFNFLLWKSLFRPGDQSSSWAPISIFYYSFDLWLKKILNNKATKFQHLKKTYILDKSKLQSSFYGQDIYTTSWQKHKLHKKRLGATKNNYFYLNFFY